MIGDIVSMTGKNSNVPLAHDNPMEYQEEAVIAERVEGGYLVVDGDNVIVYVDAETGQWDFCQVRDDFRAWVSDDS